MARARIIQASVDEQTYKAVEAIAKKEERTVSKVVAKFIATGLKAVK
jgi:hypothetical protein